MTTWGRDVRQRTLDLVSAPVATGREPRLVPSSRQEVRARVAARVPAYTPDWTNQRPDDAGTALVRVYGTLSEAVLTRLNRVPRAMLLDHVAIAGVRPQPARSAVATLAVEVLDRASSALTLPEGTAFLAPGAGAPVVFETTQPCDAIPGHVAAIAVTAGGLITSSNPDALGAGVHPFGAPPEPRAVLWIGLATSVQPGPALSLAITLVPPIGRPAASATSRRADGTTPLVRWEAIVGGTAVAVAVDDDATGGLVRDGVIRLQVPPDWSASTIPGRSQDPPLRWLRAVLVTATYPRTARVASVVLNGVRARAARTVRGEVAIPAGRTPDGRARYALSQTPVIRGSVVLEVQDAAADVFGTAGSDVTGWEETDDLASAAPTAAVFELDPQSGELTFGDGRHGRAVPDGFRHVIARSYAVGGGTAGVPAAGDSLTPQRSQPDLDAARILATTRGADSETADQLVLRGPEMIRSRGRAVLAADYASLALTAPSVEIARAHCLPGRDPRYPGATVPGVVGVLVVPAAESSVGPPAPDQPTLQAVSEHLAREVGVLGAEVVVAPPRYRRIGVRAVLVARVGTDLAALLSSARACIDAWLDPVTGGTAGTGWGFGAPVVTNDLVHLLLARVDRLVAVSSPAFTSDGRRMPACATVELDSDELTWPDQHRLHAIAEETAR